MSNMKQSKIFIGDKRYRMKTGNTSNCVLTYPSLNYYDELGNSAIRNITVSIETNDEDLDVTFTPITNSEILNAVANEEMCIMIQALAHAPSGGGKKYRKIKNAIFLPADSWETAEHEDTPKRFVRIRAHNSETYGKTWYKLTRSQLSSGNIKLLSLKDILGSNEFNTYGNYGGYNKIIVEIFVAALHRSGKDTFWYERQGNRAVSNIAEYDY